MKRFACFALTVGFMVAVLGCKKEPLIDQTQRLEQGYCWIGSFNAESGVELDVELNVTSGGAVDVLLMDPADLAQFEGLFKQDSVRHANVDVEPDSFDDFYFTVKANALLTLTFSSDYPADIGLYHQNGSTIVEYDGVTNKVFTYSATQAETLDFYTYNPDSLETLTYGLLITSPKSTSFTYYIAGSALNVTSKAYTFETPEAGDYNIVVNNAGGVAGGATPKGPVDFDIIVK